MASGVDIIARGMAATARASLNNKADLINGKVPASQLPSYVDDVIEGYYYNNKFYLEETHVTEIVPESGKIYVDLSSNKSYRWSGSMYIQIGGPGVEIQYIELTGWDESAGWHDGGTLTEAQGNILVANEMNYIWLNNMHRLDFRYRDNANNKATYSASDNNKTHTIEITLSDRTWKYSHALLQEKLTAADTIEINDNTIGVNPNLELTTLTTTSTAKLNGSIEIRKLANNKNGIIGEGCLVLNRGTATTENAIGDKAVILGDGCVATDEASIAAGKGARAGGSAAMAINKDTKAIGKYSFAQGIDTFVSGVNSQAFGNLTAAIGGNQTVIGKLNIPDQSNNLFIVGNGTEEGKKTGRSEAIELVGFYVINKDQNGYAQRYIEITADNCQSIWDDANITTIYKLSNAFAVGKDGSISATSLKEDGAKLSDKYQEKLTAGSGIKLENNIVSADIRTYKPFPSSWPHTTGTTIASFCAAVNASYKAGEIKVGDAFLGNVSSPAFFNGAYIEGGSALGSAEVSVQIMTPFGQNCVQLLTTTSSNNAPYHWEYTYVDGAITEGWRSWTDVRQVNSSYSTTLLKYLSLNGTTYKVNNLPDMPEDDGEYKLVVSGGQASWEKII